MKTFLMLAAAAVLLTSMVSSCGREAPFGTLEVVSEPAGALVSVTPAGDAAKTSPTVFRTPFRETMGLGSYRVAIQLDGYLITPTERLVTIAPAQLTHVEFDAERLGLLEVDSTPPGAAIWLDGVDSGEVTPHTFTLIEGDYEVALALVGYLDPAAPFAATVDGDETSVVSAVLPASGFIAVHSDPAGASITLDDEELAMTTPLVVEVAVGDHTLRLAKAGFDVLPASATVTVTQGSTIDASFTLIAQDATGQLSVTSTPTGAAIVIDGLDAGQTTPWTFTLPYGSHSVLVTLAGYLAPTALEVDVPPAGTAAADFQLEQELLTGDMTVTSIPAGAAIVIDGDDTGEITPHTFTLDAADYSVSVARQGFHPADARVTTVIGGDEVAQDFPLTAAKIVLLETMSGVNCEGCPAMNTMLLNVESAGYHADRLLGIKYSGPFGGSDLHFNANTAVLQARMTFYASNTIWNWAAPTLFFDGDLAVAPDFNNGYPSFGDMVLQLDAALAADPGFAIDVAVVDYDADPIVMTIDLIPTREITGTNVVLNVAVVENPVLYDTPPGAWGETEFHWICREFVQVSSSPLPVSPAAPGHFAYDLAKQANWTGVVSDNLWTIVFVQNQTTLEVLQAGALAPTSAAAPAAATRLSTIERNRR